MSLTQSTAQSRALSCRNPYPSSCSTDLYNISNTRGKVGTFCIFKTVYKIGEDVIGTFSFSEGDIPCLQVIIVSGIMGERQGFRVREREKGLGWHWALRVSSGTQLGSPWEYEVDNGPVLSLFGKWSPQALHEVCMRL